MKPAIYETPLLLPADGLQLAGKLYRNVDNLIQPQIGIVTSGSWLTVKEQMAHRYASLCDGAGGSRLYGLDLRFRRMGSKCRRTEADRSTSAQGRRYACGHSLSAFVVLRERKQGGIRRRVCERDECALPDNAKRVHDRIRAPKKLIWHPGFQVDYYDRDDLVRVSVDATHEHFGSTL